ncbi:MAG: sodium:solute symporter family protein [Gammaproteobacteria bacterium]|nr:sodium:solute symporter family protein [Gammaproteobacteria bacterium]MDH5310962.1 sodium:solute symporter family protein [Gammaproteobacteria bacterium]
MTTLHLLDFVAMAIYFAVLVWIGIAVARSGRGEGESESFLAADRNMNLLQTTCSTAATDLGGGFSIAMGGLGFTLGISGSWLIAVSGLSIVMVSFLMVPKVKRWSDRVKGLTTGDMFEARFDQRTGLLAAIVIGIAWFTFVGGQIIAGGKLLQVTMNISLAWGVAVSGAIILAYTAMGGLKAVIYTDVFQMFVLMIGIVFIAVPIGMVEVGGWSAMVEHFGSNPGTASLVDWTAVGWKQMLGWFFAIFPVWFISIAAMQRIVAARDERTARLSFFLTGVPIEWPLFAIGSTLVGLIARMLLPDLADPELATPTIIMELLPAGVAGIVIAAYIAAVMSSADSCLIGPVAIFVNDIYRKQLRPLAPERELVRVARIATIVLGLLAIGIAYLVPNVLDLILYAYTFGAAGLFFPMLGLLFWRRTTASGAYWSMLTGGTSAVIWAVLDEPFGFSASWAGWVVGLPVLIVVSLLSTHSPDENPDLFN